MQIEAIDQKLKIEPHHDLYIKNQAKKYGVTYDTMCNWLFAGGKVYFDTKEGKQ